MVSMERAGEQVQKHWWNGLVGVAVAAALGLQTPMAHQALNPSENESALRDQIRELTWQLDQHEYRERQARNELRRDIRDELRTFGLVSGSGFSAFGSALDESASELYLDMESEAADEAVEEPDDQLQPN